ncbi:MAG TPA: Na(+)/H(+) antiporter subunit B [Desulfosalsimonadaceae bacterium]|nr:Na(+)/H(+) antiporter subunit B [Desulfosalsimonadaceae bacterium]
MKRFAFICILLFGAVLLYGTMDFPAYGDPESPASQHVSPYYIEKAIEDTAVPNLVTAVLADYRGYDTLFETAVIFTAGLACFILLRRFRREPPQFRLYRHLDTGVTLIIEQGGKEPTDSDEFRRIDSQWVPYDLIMQKAVGLVVPFLQLFALYVIAHGHHSPGGGFQGGVIFGATLILIAISNDLRSTTRRISETISSKLASTGVLIYAGTGALCLLLGANFLNYSQLSKLIHVSTVMARSHGILLIEIGVGLAVAAVMIWIYYNLVSAGRHDEGL